MNQHSFQSAVGDGHIVYKLCDERDRPHFSNKRRAKADLVDTAHDVGRSCWHIMPFGRIYVDNDYVAGFTTIDQREEHRITQIATVPIVLAFDLDGLIKIWKARGREHACQGDLVVSENARFAAADIRSAAEQLHNAFASQAVEVDNFLNDRPEWIDVQGVKLIRRQYPREQVEEKISWRMFQAVVVGQPVVPRRLENACGR